VSAFANLPISRKLTAAFAAVIAVIFVSGTILHNKVGVLQEAGRRHLHADRMGEVLDTMTRAVLDQEAGLRGYLVTGDESFLERYRRGGDAFTMAFRRATALSSDNPSQGGRLVELNRLAMEWWGIAGRQIALMAHSETREEARSLERSRVGDTVMDLIRAKADEIDTVEGDLSAQSLAVQKQAYAAVYRVTILGGITSLVTAMLMGFLLTRGVAAPIKRMTSAMAALAKGDTGVQVPGVGRKDETGEMAAAVQVFRDSIIERNRAEAALQESEEKWRAIFENNPTMYFMVDSAGTVLSVNPFGAEQLGYTVDELMGDSVLNVFHESDRPTAQHYTTACIEQLGRAMSWELRKVRKDGSILWVRETAKAMLIKERPVVLIVCEDMTERKWAEYLTAQMFERSPDGIMLIGRDYRFQRINPVYERIFGRPAAMIVGKHISDLVETEDLEHIVKPKLDRCFAGEEVSFADWFSHPAGRRYRAVTYSPLQRGSAQVEAALVISRDLTDHMLSYEALRATQTELAHANRVVTMGQMTASIAHEVNQPITAAVANANSALRWLGAQPPDLEEARNAVGRIIENGRRASDVIGRIRALIKKAPARKDLFDLNEAVLGIISLTRSEMLSNGVSLQTGFATGLPSVHGDRVQLQQVVLNLIVNAIEAMSDIDRAARALRISTERDASGDVLVTIRDSGPGIDPKSVDRLFQAFHTTKPGGMGMGLAICRSIIEAHGGRLWASANEPRGAVFQFTFPPARDETVPAEKVG
jgi:PAS domain S-box-containing protein